MRDHKHEGKNPRFNRFAPIVCGVLWVPPHTSGFLIVNIQHSRSGRLRRSSEQIQSLLSFRTTKIIGTLHRVVGRGENQPDYLVVCTQHKTPDQAASDVIPAIANESEQASPTGCCWNLAAINMPQKQNTSPIILCYTLFFTVNACWES